MNIRVYQINLNRDIQDAAFIGLQNMATEQERSSPDSAVYDKVFDGEVAAGSLEEVFSLFNVDHPTGYRGRSMAVSDVVEVVENGTSRFYFCDYNAFVPIDFDPAETQEFTPRTIQVVLVEPGKLARIAEIGSDLRALQTAVNGYIEAIYPFEEEVCIACNEEGKLNGLPLNRAVRIGGEVTDIIAGTFIVCDCSGENFGSLTPEQQKRYMELFRKPEIFLRTGRGIRVIPYLPDRAQER